MSSSKTTTTDSTFNRTQSNLPPDWTQSGLSMLGHQVSAAINEPRPAPYNGNFNPIMDWGTAGMINSMYQGAGNHAAMLGQNLRAATQAMPWTPSFGGGQTFQGLGANAPQMAGFVMPEYLAAPNVQANAPTLAAPTMQTYNPNQWGGGTNGEARLNAALTAAIQPVMRELQGRILPGLRSDAIASGAYTGDRAMGVVPGMAVSDAMGRANEITQGLAYEGFQEEQNRSLAAWQAFEDLMLGATADRNQEQISLYDITGDFMNTQYGIQSDAAMTGYQIGQDARLRGAGMQNDYNINSYNSIMDALLREGGLVNQSYGLNTERGLGTHNAQLATNQNMQQSMLNEMLLRTSQPDLWMQGQNVLMGQQGQVIQDALSRDQYNLESPYRGMDIAAALLTQLSGNWGTQNASGQAHERKKEETGGLGSILQGIMGVGGMAASIFGGGGLGLGSALGAAKAGSQLFNPAAAQRSGSINW